jgi:hypothetical protein
MIKALALAAASVLTVACVATRADIVGTACFAPRPEGHPIVVFEDLSDVPGNFTKVAIVYADGDTYASWERVMRALKEEARSLGADAIVLRSESTEVEGFTEYGVSRSKHKSALAIRLHAEGERTE